MKKKFEEPEMQIIVFGSEDTMMCASGANENAIDLAKLYGSYDGGGLYVISDDK